MITTMTVTIMTRLTRTWQRQRQRHLENIFKEWLETCDLWDIWSEWWGDMTWPTKRQRQRVMRRHDLTTTTIMTMTFRAILETWDLTLETLIHFWQLRTTINIYIVTLELRVTFFRCFSKECHLRTLIKVQCRGDLISWTPAAAEMKR